MASTSTSSAPSNPGSSPLATGYVGGRSIAGGETSEIFNPADTREHVGTVRFSTASEAAEAVEASVSAGPAWAAIPLAERTERLQAAAAAVGDLGPSEDLAVLLTREQGKILGESRFEASRVGGLVDLFAGLAERALHVETLIDGKGRLEKGHVPVGATIAITPWNWPVSLSMGKVAPALLTGNTLTLKPPPNTPLAISRIIETMAAHLPPGVLNIVHGGADVGAALVAHPKVRKVVFTGSTGSGRKVFAACAPSIKTMTLELGGNDAAVILDDIILDDETVDRMARSIFITSGQVCWAIKRVYAPASRYAEVVDALVAAANRLVIGNGLDPAVSMGPLNNAVQLGIVTSMVSEARSLGARIIECGSVAPNTDLSHGHFHRPTIVADVPDHAQIVQDEQFGPALPVLAYDTVDDVILRANATEFGLSASVWTSDPQRGFEVARRLEAGQVFVNCHAAAALDYENGFGGIKQSGIGREMGVAGLQEYLEPRLYSSRVLR